MNCVDCHNNHELHGQKADCPQCTPGPRRYLEPPTTVMRTPVPDLQIVPPQHHPRKRQHRDAHRPRRQPLMPGLPFDHLHELRRLPRRDQREDRESRFRNRSHLFHVPDRVEPQPQLTRPYKYVPLRHVPAIAGRFRLLRGEPAPKLNAPANLGLCHTAQYPAKTPQTESCNACHGNSDIFLTVEKINPEEIEANLPVIVPAIPAAILG